MLRSLNTLSDAQVMSSQHLWSSNSENLSPNRYGLFSNMLSVNSAFHNHFILIHYTRHLQQNDQCRIVNGCFAVCCLVKIRKLIRLTNPVSTLTELDVQQKKRLCVSCDRDHSHHGKKCYYPPENEINKCRKIRQ